MNDLNSDYKISVTLKGYNISIVTVLTSVFLILKLSKVINWDWVWVVSPLWIDMIIMIIIYFIAIILITVVKEKSEDYI